MKRRTAETIGLPGVAGLIPTACEGGDWQRCRSFVSRFARLHTASVGKGVLYGEAYQRFAVSDVTGNWLGSAHENRAMRVKRLRGDQKTYLFSIHRYIVLTELGPARASTMEGTCQALVTKDLVFGFGTLQRLLQFHKWTRKSDRTPVSLGQSSGGPAQRPDGDKVRCEGQPDLDLARSVLSLPQGL